MTKKSESYLLSHDVTNAEKGTIQSYNDIVETGLAAKRDMERVYSYLIGTMKIVTARPPIDETDYSVNVHVTCLQLRILKR